MYFKHIQYVKAKEECRKKKDSSHSTSSGGQKFWEIVNDKKL
jgi:hypothetical protein